MTKVRDVMSLDAIWVSPETTLLQAARMMRDHDIGFLPIGENDKLVGTVTDRDIAVRGMAACYHPQSDTVRSVMTPKIYYCFDDQEVDEICANMADIKVSRLPVVNRKKRLVGIVSIGDLAQGADKGRLAKAFAQIKRNGQSGVRKKAA